MNRHDEERQKQAEVFSKGVENMPAGRAQTDTAGVGGAYGMIQGNQIMDKRIIIQALHQRASLLRSQAEGVDRLAQIVGAASDHDFALFAALGTILK